MKRLDQIVVAQSPEFYVRRRAGTFHSLSEESEDGMLASDKIKKLKTREIKLSGLAVLCSVVWLSQSSHHRSCFPNTKCTCLRRLSEVLWEIGGVEGCGGVEGFEGFAGVDCGGREWGRGWTPSQTRPWSPRRPGAEK